MTKFPQNEDARACIQTSSVRVHIVRLLLLLLAAGMLLSFSSCGRRHAAWDEVIIAGPETADPGPALDFVREYITEQCSHLDSFAIQLLHHLGTLELENFDYSRYLALATYEDDEEKMVSRIRLGVRISDGTSLEVEEFLESGRPFLGFGNPVLASRIPHILKYAPGGMSIVVKGWVRDPDVNEVKLLFDRGEIVLEADEYPFFAGVLGETHAAGGDPAIGFGRDIRLRRVIAYDSEGRAIFNQSR